MEELKNLAIEKNTPEAKPSRKEEINLSRLTELRCLVDKLYSATAVNQDDQTYQANHNLVKSLSNNEIVDLINYFEEPVASVDPHFYAALIAVAGERGLDRPYF